MTKPKKINVKYIESNKPVKKEDKKVLEAVKKKQLESDGDECPFCQACPSKTDKNLLLLRSHFE